MSNLDLLDDWQTLRVGQPVQPAPTQALDGLAESLLCEQGRPYVVLTGNSPQERGGSYRDLCGLMPSIWADTRDARAWVWSEPITDWVQRVGRIPVLRGTTMTGPWAWLYGLAATETLCVGEPLRRLTDTTGHLLHEAMRLFLAFRFHLLAGHPEAHRQADLLLRSLQGEAFTEAEWGDTFPDQARGPRIAWLGLTARERLNILMLFLCLGYQNGIIGKSLWAFDDLEEALRVNARTNLRALHELLGVITRWSNTMPQPVRLVVGLNPGCWSKLRKATPKLAGELAWAR